MEQFLTIINNPIFLLIIVAWTMFWKGLALWRAVKCDQQYWFVAMLVLNTLGILEIVYLGWFAKEKTLWKKIKEKLPWKR